MRLLQGVGFVLGGARYCAPASGTLSNVFDVSPRESEQ